MTNSNYYKYRLTSKILAELPKSCLNDLCQKYDVTDVDSLMVSWWYTGRQSGLRLTDAGNTAFNLANIEYIDVEYILSKGIFHHKFVLELGKKIKCPYYLWVKYAENNKVKSRILYIRLYDSQIAMMIILYGSLEEYLNSVKPVY